MIQDKHVVKLPAVEAVLTMPVLIMFCEGTPQQPPVAPTKMSCAIVNSSCLRLPAQFDLATGFKSALDQLGNTESSTKHGMLLEGLSETVDLR
jgi:hypothetical protein